MHYLFVAALKEEIDFSFLNGLKNVSNLYTGVGKTNSAINLLRHLYEDNNIDLNSIHIINVGTCGSSKYNIGDIISVTKCQEFGADFVSTSFKLDKIFIMSPVEYYKGSVLSSDFFISADIIQGSIFNNIANEYNCFDMEVAALARVCNNIGIKFSSFKIVSDRLNSGISDWQKVLSSLSPQLEQLVKMIIVK